MDRMGHLIEVARYPHMVLNRLLKLHSQAHFLSIRKMG
jgi:hypothetical protein